MNRARSLMVLGTASHVGKSILTATLCRILADNGHRVAPFKAQNMALNSAATPDGLEIGRAQALQAEACRIAPRVEMNPVLIKPSSETGAQIVVMGKVWRQTTAADYFGGGVLSLFPMVVQSFERLASEHDVVVLEGAGSPAEINLKDRDIVNLRMARAAGAACLLVADIDRGGVFASLYGTMALLEPEERALIRGFVINKFRGDLGLLEPGIRMIEERIERPCLGVIPYLRDIGLEEEDGVAIEDRRTVSRVWRGIEESQGRPLRIGVVALPHMSNFTDFDALADEPSAAVAFLENAEDAGRADVLIVPGTKQTLHDLAWLRQTGFADAILRFRGCVLGVCGGMQMLGRRIADPLNVEGGGEAAGLGLLPISTVLAGEKTTERVTGHAGTTPITGYEIHMGETHYEPGAQPFARIVRCGAPLDDGAVNGRITGTYLHGLFDSDAFRHAWLEALRREVRLQPASELRNRAQAREAKFNRWAAHVRQHLRMDLIYDWLGL